MIFDDSANLRTWNDAATQWLRETVHKKTHKDDCAKLVWIHGHWNGRSLRSIDRMAIQALSDAKLQEGVSPATVNRYLALVRAILRRAWREWEWIERVPFVRLLSEPRRRVRWLSSELACKLLDLLPALQRDVVLFALSTGLRHANVVGIRWDQIDRHRRVAWLFADQVKNGEDLHVSLNDTALEILDRRKGKHQEFVFSWRGKQLKNSNTRAWRRALREAGIENFRWHDLRHTWASWLVQEGVPLYALQEMGGWKSVTMVRRYAHLAPAYNLKHAQVIDRCLGK
jgi:integrase